MTRMFTAGVAVCAAMLLSPLFAKDRTRSYDLGEESLEKVLSTQLDTGGWSKAKLGKGPDGKWITNVGKTEATIDNDATTSEIAYLIRYCAAHGAAERARAALDRALDWLIAAQLPNGGWPQFPGREKGYWTEITFNDNAMVNVLRLLRDISRGEGDCAIFPPARREECRRAVERGVDCILKCQIRVDGKPTVWCQQHDRVTLEPCRARAYELPSFCTMESANIVLFLMELEPTPEIEAAIQGAADWFRSVSRTPDGRWARFYDFDEVKPFFCGRDGVMRRNLDEIEKERRTGYGWFNRKPEDVLKRLEKRAKKAERAKKKRK